MGRSAGGRQGAKRRPARAEVKSAARTVEIIEYLSHTTAPVRTTEVSAALGLPNSSTDEVLRTLAAKGFLTFNRRSKRYAPSYKIITMAEAIERGYFGGDRLRMLMRDLRSETGASVYLTAQNDCWVENVAAVRGSWQEPEGHDDGYRRELVYFDGRAWLPSTNFAGALLTQYSNGEIIDLAVRSQKLATVPCGQYILKDLIDRVKRIRSRGFAICRRDDTVKVESVACPMRIPHSNSPLAVGLLGNSLFDSDQSAVKLAVIIQRLIAHHVKNWRCGTA